MAVLAGEASDRTRLQRTALFPEDSNLARCCFAVTARVLRSRRREIGSATCGRRLPSEPSTREQFSVHLTLLSHLSQLEESARGVGDSLRRRFDCVFSTVKERNSRSRISFQPLPVTVISSSHLQLEASAYRSKREGTCQCVPAPRFPTSKEQVPQLLQWSRHQYQHSQHISVGGFRVSLRI